jgi:hypothetical protein
VRPYLYYVGFWSSSPSSYQPKLEECAPHLVEASYVRLGRQFLLSERSKERGLVQSKPSTCSASIDGYRYFLAERDWASYNEGAYEGFPFGWEVHCPPLEEGDQGFQRSHELDEYIDDCCRGVIKVSSPFASPTFADDFCCRQMSERLYPPHGSCERRRKIMTGTYLYNGCMPPADTGRWIWWARAGVSVTLYKGDWRRDTEMKSG